MADITHMKMSGFFDKMGAIADIQGGYLNVYLYSEIMKDFRI